MTNLFSYTAADNGRRYGVASVYPDREFDNAISIDGATNVEVKGWSVPGGRRSVVDINSCQQVEVRLEEAAPAGYYAASIKHSSKVHLKLDKLPTRGKMCDILVAAKDVSISVVPADGKPVRVVALRGRPTYKDLGLGGKSGPYTYAFSWPVVGILGYVLGPICAYANPGWLGYPVGRLCGWLFR